MLLQQFTELGQRETLLAMAEQARKLAKPDATNEVLEYCFATIGEAA